MLNIILIACIYVGYQELVRLQDKVIVLERNVNELLYKYEKKDEPPEDPDFELLFNNLE